MLIYPDGTVVLGFDGFEHQAEIYGVAYDGFSGEIVLFIEDEFFADCALTYDLPPSHLFSFQHNSNICAYCGAEGSTVLDHIVPFAKGGSHLQREYRSVDNKAPACDPCNASKGSELGWKTLDGRSGFYWDGTPGDSDNPPPLPVRAPRKRRKKKLSVTRAADDILEGTEFLPEIINRIVANLLIASSCRESVTTPLEII